VLGPVPLPPNDVPNCLSAHPRELVWCTPTADPAVIAGIEAERQAVTGAGGNYVDVRPWFCDATGCVVILGNILVYRDQNHLTTEFAGWLSPILGATLDALGASP
jgi:hypothetical protein